MNEGILLASDIDFMIHGIFKVKVFGQEVWITDSHACILIVMAVMVIFAVIANRKLKHATEKPDTFQNIIELIVEKLTEWWIPPWESGHPDSSTISARFLFLY